MPKPVHLAIAPVLLVLLALGGCDERGSHADDAIYLTPHQQRDIFLTTGNLGPDTDVILLANVPKARYEQGAIVLTGGTELEIVQPHAWRTYTGTALSTEEADREIARAKRLEAAIHDVAEASTDLRIYLDDRSATAKQESDRMQAQDIAWKQDQQRQEQAALSEANRLQRTRDEEVGRIVQDRDDRVAAVYKQGAAEIQELTDALAHGLDDLAHRYGDAEAKEDADYRQEDDHLRKSEAFEHDLAQSQSKGQDYLDHLDEAHRKQHADLDSAHSARLASIHDGRDAAVSALRSDTARKIDDQRRLTETKAERIRREADQRLDAVQADEANATAPATAQSTLPTRTSPSPAPSRSTTAGAAQATPAAPSANHAP